MTLGRKLSIDELKNYELEILKVFADFCNKNNLKYYLAYGTLIGAVRHKGFIPWDDDIDVQMSRPDYNKMIEILKKFDNHLTENIVLFTPYTKNFQYPFCKIVNTNTFVHESTMKNNYNTGIWIDIFPIDAVPKNNTLKHIKKLAKIRKYYFYTIEKKYTQKSILGKIRFKLVQIFFTPICKIFNMKARFDKMNQKLDFETAELFATTIDINAENTLMTKSDFNQTKILFEGIEFTTFENYDSILRNFYGDYMQLPPIEKQVYTHSIEAYLLGGNE